MVLLIFQIADTLMRQKTKKYIDLWDYYEKCSFLSKVLKQSKEKLRLINYPLNFVIEEIYPR